MSAGSRVRTRAPLPAWLCVRDVRGWIRRNDTHVLVELWSGVDQVTQHDAYVLAEREFVDGEYDSGTLHYAGTLHIDEIYMAKNTYRECVENFAA